MGNAASESDFERGDVLYRTIDGMLIANHYGVYVGEGDVIHFSRELGICKMSLKDFSRGYEVSNKSSSNSLPRDEIVQKACYYLKNPSEWGEYNLALNNCEHFATYCATGEKISGQVRKTVAAVATGVAIGAAGVTTGAIVSRSKDKEPKEDVRRTLARDEVVENAKYHLKESQNISSYYNLISNNCENFATKCATEYKESQQVESVAIPTPDIGLRVGGYRDAIDPLAGAFNIKPDPFSEVYNEKRGSYYRAYNEYREPIFEHTKYPVIFESAREYPQQKDIDSLINPFHQENLSGMSMMDQFLLNRFSK